MFWKRKTDDEYVGMLKKLFFGWSKPLAAMHALVSGAGAVLSLILIWKMQAVKFLFGEDFEFGFLMGAFAGFVFLVVFVNAIMALIIFFKPRSIRLLIEYHERLRDGQK